MRVELRRDDEGRPAAILVCVGGFGVRQLVGRLWRRLPKAPRQLARPARAVVTGVRVGVAGIRAGIPEVSLRRDPDGQPSAIVLRLGAAVASAAPPSPSEPLRERAIHLLRSLGDAIEPLLPRATLQRDPAGRPAAVRVQFGAAALVPAPAAGTLAHERPKKWVIEAVGADLFSQLQEFWRYRRMLLFFSTRAVTRMYRGMNLGIFWLFARPLIPIAISTLIFGSLLGVPSEGVPYFMFFLAGQTSWMLFERSMMWATRSLDMSKGLIKKVYFPRLIVPVASVAPALVDAFTYTGLLVAAAVYYRIVDRVWYLRLGPGLGLAAIAAVLSVVFAIGVGLWTTIWQVRYREVRYTLRYVLRFWNYLTPVMYPLSQVPEKYHWIVFLNPMAPLVETFKWGVLGVGELNLRATVSGICVIALTLAGGVWYFNKFEASSVDKL